MTNMVVNQYAQLNQTHNQLAMGVIRWGFDTYGHGM